MRFLPKTLLLLLVALCLGQVVWWVFFALGETGRTAQEKREILRGRCYQALVLLHRASHGKSVPQAWKSQVAERFPDLELLHVTQGKAGSKEPSALGSKGIELGGVEVDPKGAAGEGGSEERESRDTLAHFEIRPRAAALAAITEETQRRRRMFYWEGGTLTTLIILGVLLLYRSLRNDIEIRKGHQRFLAGATHELKTPLSSLQLALETLKTGAVSPERTDAFYGNMLLEVERLQNQIENLLKAASLRGRPDTKKKVNLARLLEEVVGEQRPRYAEKDLDIHCEIEARNPWVQGDEAALRQCLVNLVDNARLYSPKGGRVQLKLEDGGQQLSFVISNSGEGIPEQDRSRVFDRFFRGKDTRETGGSGLGLYLARQVAKDHGGQLLLLPSAERAMEERLTTFALLFPKMRNET